MVGDGVTESAEPVTAVLGMNEVKSVVLTDARLRGLSR